ncbi:hypothetical protein FV232_27220 [Methylobacterium sp. WL30]|nr:hypothetical protein FV225_08050 [Methylobacterium sp. WL93]TXN46790.1 hypothetical protein FV227_22775 [Methylobacterium sp. WL119]TXN61361.1 hypothetical protein FV232_27220 [Methylobacterium sp. WL30]
MPLTARGSTSSSQREMACARQAASFNEALQEIIEQCGFDRLSIEYRAIVPNGHDSVPTAQALGLIQRLRSGSSASRRQAQGSVMRGATAIAGLVAGLTAASASAQSLTVTQMRQANVYGVIQVGPQVRPVTVRQTGEANMAGVWQVGPSTSATINQSGRTNSAFINQSPNMLAPNLRQQMP